MKLIIDIPEEQYKTLNATTQDEVVTCIDDRLLINAIKNGTPLDDVLNKIRAEIAEYKDDKIIHFERNEMIDIVLDIIDKYRERSE